MLDKNRKKSLDAVMTKINKKFGDKSIAVMRDVEEELKVKFYKTPSYEVNIALGGGIGVSKVVEFYGNPGCGKTSLALETIAYNQKIDPSFIAAWLETERSLDFDYMITLGIDMDRLIIIQQEEDLTAESCMDILRSLMSSGEINMIVLNSCAALCPQKEVDDDLEKQNIALKMWEIMVVIL